MAKKKKRSNSGNKHSSNYRDLKRTTRLNNEAQYKEGKRLDKSVRRFDRLQVNYAEESKRLLNEMLDTIGIDKSKATTDSILFKYEILKLKLNQSLNNFIDLAADENYKLELSNINANINNLSEYIRSLDIFYDPELYVTNINDMLYIEDEIKAVDSLIEDEHIKLKSDNYSVVLNKLVKNKVNLHVIDCFRKIGTKILYYNTPETIDKIHTPINEMIISDLLYNFSLFYNTEISDVITEVMEKNINKHYTPVNVMMNGEDNGNFQNTVSC